MVIRKRPAMVFSCASTPSVISCDSSDLQHAIAALESSTLYNQRRIVLKFSWLTHCKALGAPADATTKWGVIQGQSEDGLAQLLRDSLFVGDHAAQNRFAYHGPVAEVLRDEIIVPYYKHKFTPGNFAIGAIRRIFADETGNTNNGTGHAAALFTTDQMGQVVTSLLRQHYLVRTGVGDGIYTWRFANIVAGDTIGIPVQYKDTVYDGDIARTDTAAGFFLLCVEHDPTLAGYECEYQDRVGHASLAGGQIVGRDGEQLAGEFAELMAHYQSSLLAMADDMEAYSLRTSRAPSAALLAVLARGVHGGASLPPPKEDNDLSLNPSLDLSLDLAGITWSLVRGWYEGKATNVATTGFGDYHAVVGAVRDWSRDFTREYWDVIRDIRAWLLSAGADGTSELMTSSEFGANGVTAVRLSSLEVIPGGLSAARKAANEALAAAGDATSLRGRSDALADEFQEDYDLAKQASTATAALASGEYGEEWAAEIDKQNTFSLGLFDETPEDGARAAQLARDTNARATYAIEVATDIIVQAGKEADVLANQADASTDSRVIIDRTASARHQKATALSYLGGITTTEDMPDVVSSRQAIAGYRVLLQGYAAAAAAAAAESILAGARTDALAAGETAVQVLADIGTTLGTTTQARNDTLGWQGAAVFGTDPSATAVYKTIVDQAVQVAKTAVETVKTSLEDATAAEARLDALSISIQAETDSAKAAADLERLRTELDTITAAQKAANDALDLAEDRPATAKQAVTDAVDAVQAAAVLTSPTYTLTSAAAAIWTPIGTIAGTQYCDRTGTIVCVSDDGKTIASRGGGPIRVYRYQQATGWGQLGPDVPSDSHGNNTISLSADGNILAIGMQWWDETYVTDGSGKVTIVQYTDGAWSVIGEIKGWDDIRTGCSVSLSADGHTVAMGAYMHKADGYKSGHVRIHRYDATTGTTWPRLGDIIPGNQYDEAGRTGLSLSADGTTVTVTTRVTGEQADEGKVRIFKYGDGVWDQMGEGIPGEGVDGPRQTSLSADGTVVAIGAYGNDGAAGRDSGHVRVYKFHPDRTTKWRQIGDDIDGEAKGDASGASVSLSADGTMLAIGAPANDASSGHIRIFKNIGNEWVQVGPDIDGVASGDRAGSSVSLTADGTTVAVGECNYSTDLTQYVGRIRVFTTDEVPIPTFTRTTTTSGPGGVPLYTDGPQYTVQSGLPSDYYYRFYGNGNSKIGLVLKSLSDAGTATSADVYRISKVDWNDPAKFPDGPGDA